jgi:hypothetical protein
MVFFSRTDRGRRSRPAATGVETKIDNRAGVRQDIDARRCGRPEEGVKIC